MWRLIALFSFLTGIFLWAQIKKEFELSVELRAQQIREKPKLEPPPLLPMGEGKVLDLSSHLLEPPKELELAEVSPLRDDSVGCGKPADMVAYKRGVDYYLMGRWEDAKRELSKVISMPSSYRPMALYLLGVMKVKEGDDNSALDYFKESCTFGHMYRKPACESYYALSFRKEGKPPANDDPFWKVVYSISVKGIISTPSCENVVFKKYCHYVQLFVAGQMSNHYHDSTALRRGVVLFFSGKWDEAKKIFQAYSKPLRPYRDIALYYLGVIAYKERDVSKALEYASVLESINTNLSNALYDLVSSEDYFLARMVYTLTHNRKYLEKAGIIAYNTGRYQLAYSSFMEAGDLEKASYSLMKMGDYEKVYDTLLEHQRELDADQYKLLLEAAYWAGKPMEPLLEYADKKFPQLAREYRGWDLFRQRRWKESLQYLDDPYYRALAYFNMKNYKEVITTLEKDDRLQARLLKAEAYLLLGNPAKARSYLTPQTDRELYLLGLSYFMEEDYNKAVEFFSRVPESSPLRPQALLKMGDAFYNMGDLSKAQETYRKVIEEYPDTPYARQATLALLEAKPTNMNIEQETKLIEDYLKKDPDSPTAQHLKLQLAKLYIQQNRLSDAQRLLLDLVGTPVESRALLLLADIEPDVKKRLVLLYKVYKEGPPTDAQLARQKLIDTYQKLGDKDSVAALLSEGSTEDKAKAVGIYVSMKNWEKALPLAKEVISSGYHSKDFDRSLMNLYRAKKDPQILEFLLLSPDKETSAWAKYTKAKEYEEAGDYRKALELLVDISLHYRGTQVYNKAVMDGVDILMRLGARKDASCFLNRVDESSLGRDERIKVERWRRALPPCEESKDASP
ncbi:Tetratricopeptide TPR_2 repeat protein [Thermocrinis albus DSM 14484]|uniref:Tetratricopeptide TPR_2 repeat protein n=1 Tax=Thermocrinis albus (strain DSM 14484 / JCM 11386 / HI 11/12) TaxID=638303 RepID=D3SL80_THEAH|nr:tetratricopeptide repeat protein [Thermocrinis albus]ADC89510.1 Tetratricopeptide TPR_2 repeat protein [Thermocrinis albus DSM 14484]